MPNELVPIADATGFLVGYIVALGGFDTIEIISTFVAGLVVLMTAVALEGAE